MREWRGSTVALLYSGGAMALAAVAFLTVFVLVAGTSEEPAIENGGPGQPWSIVFLLAALAVSGLVFVVGFVVGLAALYSRRPLRRDPFGWMAGLPLAAASCFMAYWGLDQVVGFYGGRETLHAVPWFAVPPLVIAVPTLLGLVGIVVILAAVIPGSTREGGRQLPSAGPRDV